MITLQMNRRVTAMVLTVMILAAISEYSLGRRPWGVRGQPGIWSGDIWSDHNSQFVADPYSLTHVIHGVAFYGILSIAGRNLTVGTRLVVAAAMESGWEVLENSDFIIQRYRKETISLDYYGDSMVNSMSDIVACICGFLLAWRLPKRVTVVGTIAIEIILALWIRDNLTLNLIMLLRPSQTIRKWQLGR
jgi:Protein of unknown function (DUF2585)